MEGIESLFRKIAARGQLFRDAQGIPYYSGVLLLLFLWFVSTLIVQVDANGVFKSVFVVHYTAVDVVRAHGRPVCSTDFGHFKHDYFDGLNATGICF